MKSQTSLFSGNPPFACQRGLSLVELMVSLTIGLILLAGITTLIVRQSNTRAELEKSSRQIENGRYAMQLLHDDIQHAGFYSEYSPPTGAIYSAPDPCDITDNTANLGTTGNLGWINNSSTTPTIPVPIFGYSAAATSPAPSTCNTLITNYKPNTDILVIRRTSTDTPIAPSAAVAGTTYMQISACNADTRKFVLGTSNFNLYQRNCSPGPGTLATLRKYIVRIYYISTCSNCGTGGDTIPTLKMVEFIDGAQTTIPLVEGIENIRFEYGIDTTGNDGSPDGSYVSLPATTADWANVMAVRVSLLARNNEPTAGYQDTKSYTLGSTAISAANDSYKRHAYSQLVRAINPSGRRD